MTAGRRLLGRLWDTDRALTAVAFAMLGVFVASATGMTIDARLIGGAPAWLKPAKFGISTAIYSFTLAWIFTYLQEWPRLKRIVGRTTAAVFVLEVGLITLQAARGTTSHFNVSTPLNATVFATMGIAILVQWAASLSVAIALFRQRFTDRALGWALRLGVLIAVIGAVIGGLMTRPTDAQLDSARTARITVVGAHTVGAPDGTPGLPGTGWSLAHGDLRVPHFLGLHAMQILPAFALLLGGLVSVARRTRLVLVAAVSYGALVGILLGQALSGQSVLTPAGPIQIALFTWFAATVLGLAYALASGRMVSSAASMKALVS